MPHRMTDHDRETLAHAEAFLGPPKSVTTFDDLPGGVPCPLYVVAFPPPEPGTDWAYLTVGMGRSPQPDAVAEHRLELVLLSRQAHEGLPGVLTGLASYPFVRGVGFGPGHTVAGTPGVGVVPGSPLTEFLLVPAYGFMFGAGFGSFAHADGTHTEVVWATPVHPSERRFAVEHGWTRLVEDRFVEQEINPGDLFRPPAA